MSRSLVFSVSTAAALLLATTAGAGSLPSPSGAWDYRGTSGKVIFSFYVNVDPATRSKIYAVRGVVEGKCTYKGEKVFGSADFNVDTARGIDITVKPNGSFVSKWFKTVGDAAGEHGKAKITGTIDGRKISGEVTARTKGNALGPCSGKGEFKGRGEPLY